MTYLTTLAHERKNPNYSVNLHFPGYFTDPEGAIDGDTFWIFPILSRESGEPKLNASSPI